MKPFVKIKLIAIILLVALVFTFVACNGSTDDSANPPTQDNSASGDNKNDKDTTHDNKNDNDTINDNKNDDDITNDNKNDDDITNDNKKDDDITNNNKNDDDITNNNKNDDDITNDNKNDDDTTNDNETESGDNATDVKIVLNKLSHGDNFSSGVANISVSVEISMPDGQGGYKRPNNKIYDLVIDTEGKVLYFDHKGTYQNDVCIDINEYIVYDKSGTPIISPELQGFDSIIFSGDTYPTDIGLFIVKKIERSFSGNKTLYGVLDKDGNWKVPLSDTHPLLKIKDFNDGGIGYIGNGIYAVTTSDGYYINTVYYNAVTNQVTQGYDHFAIEPYDNGTDYYDECLFKYSSDGSVECLIFDFDGNIGEEYILVIDDSKTSLLDMNGTEIFNIEEDNIDIISYKKYEYKNGYFLCTAYNPDYDMYWCLFDSNGNLAFEPIIIEDQYDSKYCLSNEGVIYQKDRDEVYFYDYNGNSRKLEGICEIEGTSFEDGFLSAFTLSEKGYEYCYLDANGEIALDAKSIENAVIEAIRDQFFKEQE